MKILFCEVRHLVQINTSVHPISSVYIFTGSKQYLQKKNPQKGCFSLQAGPLPRLGKESIKNKQTSCLKKSLGLEREEVIEYDFCLHWEYLIAVSQKVKSFQ